MLQNKHLIDDWKGAWKAEVDEAAHWKEQALRHCNRADRAEALLAANEIHFTDGTPCWCDPTVEDYRGDRIDGTGSAENRGSTDAT